MTQLAKVGTKWIAPPKGMPEDGQEKKIEEMNLEELRPYLCAKSHWDYHACLNNCPGLSRCKAGQRAVVLVNEAAKEKSKFVKVLDESGTQEKPEKGDRALLRAACESGNAWHYLMENNHLSKDAARELLGRLIRENPGVAAEYGGSRRIVQRPKVVSITPVKAGEQEEAKEQERKPEPEPANQEQKPVESIQPEPIVKIRNPDKRTVAAREKFTQAIASGNPIQWVIDNTGCNYKAAVQRIRVWCETYPDITEPNGGKEKVFYPYLMSTEKKESMEKHEGKTTEPAEPAKPAEEDDTISLTDFLSSFEGQQEAAVDAPESIDKAIPEPEPDRSPPKGETGFIDALKAKFEELEKERATLTEEIRKAEERKECVRKQMEKLLDCLRAFGSGV